MNITLKSTISAIIGNDIVPLKSLRLLADAGEMTPTYQAIVAEHYGLAPSFAVLGVLRELAAEAKGEAE